MDTCPKDELYDDLTSWDDVAELLRDDWLEVEDVRTAMRLLCGGDDLVVIEPPGATAQHRRALHRAGFRRDTDRADWWTWAPPEPDEGDVVVPPAFGTTPRLRAAWIWHVRELRVRRWLAEAAERVLRDLRCAPPDLRVLVQVEEDCWDDEP